MSRIGPFEASQAAEVLGVDVFDLAWALNDKALALYDAERSKITDFEQPNMGRVRTFIRAANACFEACDHESEAHALAAGDKPDA